MVEIKNPWTAGLAALCLVAGVVLVALGHSGEGATLLGAFVGILLPRPVQL